MWCSSSSLYILWCGGAAAVSPYISVTPDMEEFIKEYITEVNKEVELFNHQLELQDQPDLFDPW